MLLKSNPAFSCKNDKQKYSSAARTLRFSPSLTRLRFYLSHGRSGGGGGGGVGGVGGERSVSNASAPEDDSTESARAARLVDAPPSFLPRAASGCSSTTGPRFWNEPVLEETFTGALRYFIHSTTTTVLSSEIDVGDRLYKRSMHRRCEGLLEHGAIIYNRHIRSPVGLPIRRRAAPRSCLLSAVHRAGGLRFFVAPPISGVREVSLGCPRRPAGGRPDVSQTRQEIPPVYFWIGLSTNFEHFDCSDIHGLTESAP